jgi:predicted solute-binding protein
MLGPIRIGAPEFVSVRPLVYGLLREPAARVVFAYRPPAILAEMLERELLDAALIPSIEFLRGVGRHIIEGPALVAQPGRGSALLVTRKPLETLASVAVTESCRSPVAVLRVALAETHGVTPDFLVEKNPSAWQERHDAVLLTGDTALSRLAQPEAEGETVHDVVDMWHAVTGKPLVLGTWAYNDPDLAEPLTALLVLSRNLGAQHLSRLADGIARTSAFSPEFLYDSLSRRWSYALGTEEMQGLRVLEELALKYDLLRSARLQPAVST